MRRSDWRLGWCAHAKPQASSNQHDQERESQQAATDQPISTTGKGHGSMMAGRHRGCKGWADGGSWDVREMSSMSAFVGLRSGLSGGAV